MTLPANNKLSPTISTLLSLALIIGISSSFYAFANPAATTTSAPQAPVKAKAPSTNAREIAQTVLQAYGGTENFKTCLNAPFKGKAQKTAGAAMSGATNVLDVIAYGVDNKYRVETEVLGEKVTSGYDGKISWTKHGDWVSKDTATPTKIVEEEDTHNLKVLLEVNNPTTKVESLPPVTVSEKPCDVIKITPAADTPTTLYADKQSHLILRSEYTGIDPEQGVPALKTTDYFDYRPAFGSQSPFKTIQYINHKTVSETIVQDVDFNFPVDQSLFTMPLESEVPEVKLHSITIPFDFVGERIILKAKLNNKLEEKFLLDTGASQTVLDKSVAQKLGGYANKNWSITTGGKALDVNYMTIANFTIGDINLENIVSMIYDLSAQSLQPGARIGGIIGANVLRRFLVTIDFQDKTVTLSNPHSVLIPKGATAVPTIPVFGAATPSVQATIDDKFTGNFLLDTGAPFNNMPAGMSNQILKTPVLPVSVAKGLDGKNYHIGAVRFNSLRIGNATVSDPVFAVSPDSSISTTGLFTAEHLGILGNPTWNQFRMTLDYQNERLILEPNTRKNITDKLSARLKQINREYLKTKNYNLAIAQFTEVAQSAKQNNCLKIEAQALMNTGLCYTAALLSSHNNDYATMAVGQFQKALDLAKKSGDKNVEAAALGNLADFYIKTADSPQTLMNAQQLVAKAALLGPTEATVAVAAGDMLLKIGQSSSAGMSWDQALMLDPSNWAALWGKYELAKKANDTKTQALVIAQLKRYYPDVPDVIALQKPQATTKATPAKPVKR